jgi:hypothetical protein
MLLLKPEFQKIADNALESAAKVADRAGNDEIASDIRALKWLGPGSVNDSPEGIAFVKMMAERHW